MTQICDNKSVGLIVLQEGKILLVNRKRPPFGLAPPAGHVDDHGAGLDERSQFEAAAAIELTEEVGLQADSLELLFEGRKKYGCRREGGSWHYWRVYLSKVSGEACFSTDETEGHVWIGKVGMEKLLRGETHEVMYRGVASYVPLDPVWNQLFTDVAILKYLI